MNTTPPAPPPNGFTKAMRRVMAIGSAVAFFALIAADAVGLLPNRPALSLLGGLAMIALMFFDRFADFVATVTGGWKK